MITEFFKDNVSVMSFTHEPHNSVSEVVNRTVRTLCNLKNGNRYHAILTEDNGFKSRITKKGIEPITPVRHNNNVMAFTEYLDRIEEKAIDNYPL